MAGDIRDTVRDGYADSDFVQTRSERSVREPERRFLDAFLDRLPEEGSVLYLGCGTGQPFGTYLAAQGMALTCVDMMESHLAEARENLPDATFVHDDIAVVDTYEDRFNGVMCLFTLHHVPRDEHAALISAMHQALQADGPLLLNVAVTGEDEETYRWAGGELAASSFDAPTYLSMVEDAGCEVLQSDVIGDTAFLWILAQPA